MNILLVSHYALPHSGGIEVVVDQLGAELSRAGHRVTVLSSRTGGALPRERRGAVELVRIAAANGLERWLDVPYPLFAPELWRAAHRAVAAADVVHAHGLLYMSSLAALLWSWRLSRPLVVTEHVGFVPYRLPPLNWAERAAFAAVLPLWRRRADAMIVLNAGVERWLGRRLRDPQRLHFVPNGIDTGRFSPPDPAQRAAARQALGIPPNRVVAAFVGRFVEKKGLDLLLDALDPAFELLLCGRGELPSRRDRPGARVIGEVDHARMPAVYRAADLLVLPSTGEGFPMAIMEAMACGLPVVAVRDPEYAAFGDEMLQVGADPRELHDALLRLAADAGERERRGAAARGRALSDFSLAASAARHLAVYESACRRRREFARA